MNSDDSFKTRSDKSININNNPEKCESPLDRDAHRDTKVSTPISGSKKIKKFRKKIGKLDQFYNLDQKN